MLALAVGAMTGIGVLTRRNVFIVIGLQLEEVFAVGVDEAVK